MYKLLLTFRYLRRKLIPWFALAAVTLCTAMVIIVMSVMGGFLDLVRDAGQSLIGDVTVRSWADIRGFGHYEVLIEKIEKLPEAAAATPIIEAYGVVNVSVGESSRTVPVMVKGIDGPGQQRVTGYADTLYWTDERVAENDVGSIVPPGENLYEAGSNLRNPWEAMRPGPAIVPGIEVSPFNYRQDDGTYDMGRSTMLASQWTLTVQPISAKGAIDTIGAETRIFTLVNEFKSGLFEADSRQVFIPFEIAQRMMTMDAAEMDDPNDPNGDPIPVPARCTEIQVRAAEGVTPDELQEAVANCYLKLALERPELKLSLDMLVLTWLDRQSTLITAVENEKGLLTMLFAIISAVAVVMVGVIFYMIVLQKTRDIGVLRAIGASRAGVASIFLVYGAAIGLIGAGVGTGIAYLFMRNINPIHTWLGDGLGAFCYYFGLPLGVGVLFMVIGLIYVGVQTLYDQVWWRNWLAVAVVGFVLIGAIRVAGIGWIYLWHENFPDFHRAAAEKGPLVWSGIMLIDVAWGGLLGGVALGAIGGLYMVVAQHVRAATGVRLLIAGGIGLLAAVLVRLAILNTSAPKWLSPIVWNEKISIQIWDRRVYFFEEIPSRIDGREVIAVVIVAVAASIVGALIPAISAARVDPVESLRYE